MSIDIGVTPEELDRYRRIVAESYATNSETDEAILLVGRIIQSAIDRAFNKDSVQLAQNFNQKTHSKYDSSDATLPAPRKIETSPVGKGMRLEP